jgi:hypothetical protein
MLEPSNAVREISAMANKITNPCNKQDCSTSLFAGLCFDISGQVAYTYMAKRTVFKCPYLRTSDM